MARTTFPGKSLLNAVVHLPLVLPPVVTGWLLLIEFGRQGALGRFFEQAFGLVFSFRWTGAALASAVMGFPLMVRAIRLSLEAADVKLEQVARTLGAPGWYVFVSITLPLAAPGILAGSRARLRQVDRRVWRHDHLCRQHSRPNPNLVDADLQRDAGPRRRPTTWRLTIVAIMIATAALLFSEALAARVIKANGA